MLFYKRQFVLIVLGVFLAACQPTPTLATSSTPGTSIGITDTICPTVIVQVGQQIVWTNQGSREHVVRDNSTKGSSLFDSGTLQPGDSFAFTFPQVGSYTYQCSESGDKTGTVTVQP